MKKLEFLISINTVEPVFETMIQFMGMRKINTIGLKQVNKRMHMTAIAYNSEST